MDCSMQSEDAPASNPDESVAAPMAGFGVK